MVLPVVVPRFARVSRAIAARFAEYFDTAATVARGLDPQPKTPPLGFVRPNECVDTVLIPDGFFTQAAIGTSEICAAVLHRQKFCIFWNFVL